MTIFSRRTTFRLLSLGLGVSAFVGMLEIGLRLMDWPAPGLYRDRMGPLALSMPSGDGSSWRAYPGSARLRHWDYDVPIELNRHGFIEREPVPKAPDAWRVGIFGDSFVAGMGVLPTKRFTQVWRDSLPARPGSPAVEVYNFGSAWCGSAQNAAFLESHGAEYQLDEIVLAIFGGNELEDNLAWSEYSAKSPEERRRADHAASSGSSMREWIRNHSRAAGFLFVTIAGRFSSKSLRVLDAKSIDRLWPVTEQALESFSRASGERRFTIWYLPDTHEWDDEVWGQVKREYSLVDGDRHVVRDAIARWASRSGVPFVDGTPLLAGRSAKELRFRRDGHWNEAGHRVVGAGLAGIESASRVQRDIRPIAP